MRALAVVLVLLPLALPGCAFSPFNRPDCPSSPEAGVLVPPFEGGDFMDRNLPDPWQTVALPFANEATLDYHLDGEGTLEPVAPGAALLRVSLTTREPFAYLNWTATQSRDGCSLVFDGVEPFIFTSAPAGEPPVAAAGNGVRVWYAGFWENGTMFDTNIASLDASDWPRASWYDAAVGTPLPVYIYDQDRCERPVIWSPGTACTAVSPAPVTGDVAPLYSYYTTIKGFNDGLKGLATTTTRVVWMPPEDAYGGRSDVPAGLDAPLVFLVKLAAVEDTPCASDLQACVPPPPSIPPAAPLNRLLSAATTAK